MNSMRSEKYKFIAIVIVAVYFLGSLVPIPYMQPPLTGFMAGPDRILEDLTIIQNNPVQSLEFGFNFMLNSL
jgi:hypothetical protein